MKKAIVLCLLAFTSIRINAQEEIKDTTKTVTLMDIEITDSLNGKRSLLNLPVSIVKLDETELKRNTGLYLDDAINTNVPGVFMEKRTISAGQQFNIRGYGNGVRGTNGVNSNFDG